jgi:hypothetical protein
MSFTASSFDARGFSYTTYPTADLVMAATTVPREQKRVVGF